MSAGPKRAGPGRVAVQGDDVDTVIDRLFRSESPRLQRYFRRQMRPGEEAGDFVQEAFVRLAGAANKVLPAQPAAYLQRIARNLLIDRSRLAAPTHVSDAADLPSRPDQEDALLAGEAMSIYEATLNSLPERTRTIFLLYRVEGLRYREIAERLDISIPAVQKHIAKALENLAWALQGGE